MAVIDWWNAPLTLVVCTFVCVTVLAAAYLKYRRYRLSCLLSWRLALFFYCDTHTHLYYRHHSVHANRLWNNLLTASSDVFVFISCPASWAALSTSLCSLPTFWQATKPSDRSSSASYPVRLSSTAGHGSVFRVSTVWRWSCGTGASDACAGSTFNRAVSRIAPFTAHTINALGRFTAPSHFLLR